MKKFKLFFTMSLLASSFVSSAQTSADFVTDSITTHTLLASSFINDNEGWTVDDAGTVWHTGNGSQSWSSVASEKYFLKLDFADALHGFGLTSYSAYKTTDGGSTWSVMNMPGGIISAVYFQNKDTGFISGDQVIYKTTDGGNTWATIQTAGVSFVDYYFVSGSTGIAAAYDEQSYKCIWRTTDDGATWSNTYSSENYFITSVWFTDSNNGWAAGYYDQTGLGKFPVINHTSDGGQTWTNVYMNQDPGDIKGEALIDIRFRNAQQGFALSTYSQSIITSDGGVTWSFTHDDNGDAMIPDWGMYKSLDGSSKMFLTGRHGYVTEWK